MLAQNFMTAEELHLSNDEHLALIGVLGHLERGDLKHIPEFRLIDPNVFRRRSPKFTGHFNMGHIATPAACGTVACIMGTARLLYGHHLFPEFAGALDTNNSAYRDVLGSLFYPEIPDVLYDRITTEEAATQLRSFLTTGHHGWEAPVEY